jgi:hypothetical protein
MAKRGLSHSSEWRSCQRTSRPSLKHLWMNTVSRDGMQFKYRESARVLDPRFSVIQNINHSRFLKHCRVYTLRSYESAIMEIAAVPF